MKFKNDLHFKSWKILQYKVLKIELNKIEQTQTQSKYAPNRTQIQIVNIALSLGWPSNSSKLHSYIIPRGAFLAQPTKDKYHVRKSWIKSYLCVVFDFRIIIHFCNGNKRKGAM